MRNNLHIDLLSMYIIASRDLLCVFKIDALDCNN